MAVPLADLRDDTAIMRTLAPAPGLIDAGVIAATLSSAIASILGAPRTLQRLAADRLIRPLEPFAVVAGPANNPRRAACSRRESHWSPWRIGDLDLVAPVISMFFLASYGMINYATYSEAGGQHVVPTDVPALRLATVSLLGTLGCAARDPRHRPDRRGRRRRRRFRLLPVLPAIGGHRPDGPTAPDRSMRPRSAPICGGCRPATTPAVTGDRSRSPSCPGVRTRRARLATVASWFEGAAGFTTVARIVPGRGALVRRLAPQVDLELQQELRTSELGVYGRVIVGDDLASGVASMLQAHGMGALRPNLALFSLNDGSDPEHPNTTDYELMVQTGVRHGCNVGVVSTPDRGWSRLPSASLRTPTIAVWWSDDPSGQLLTLLAWLCTRTPAWGNATIEVTVATGADERARVASLIDEARLPATVVGTADNTGFATATSRASLVLAPLRVRRGELLGPGDVTVEELLPLLPVVVFVNTASEVKLDVQPDESELAALADAKDRAVRASTRADQLSQEASMLLVSAEVLRMQESAGAGEGRAVATDPAAEEARRAATQAQRKYLDARARAEEAWRRVREIDPSATTETIDPELWLGGSPDDEQHPVS